jgi:hypothetical protein
MELTILQKIYIKLGACNYDLPYFLGKLLACWCIAYRINKAITENYLPSFTITIKINA